MTVRELVVTLAGAGILGTGTMAFVWDGFVTSIGDKVVERLEADGGELQVIEARLDGLKPLIKRYLFRVQLCATGHATAEECDAWGLQVIDSHHGRRTPIVVRIPVDPSVAELRRDLREARAGATVPPTEGGPP